jgi:type IV secretion system protein TrbJ
MKVELYSISYYTKILIGISLTLFSIHFFKKTSYAGIPVSDAANLAQNIIQAIQSINEVKNQLIELENDFKNLTTLDYSVVDEISQGMTDMMQIASQIQGLGEGFVEVQSRFEELYPDFDGYGRIDNEVISEHATAWVNENREVLKSSTQVAAHVVGTMESTKYQMTGLAHESQAAIGVLQAIQAGNQMTAILSQQMMKLNSLMSTTVQAHVSYQMKENQMELLVKKRLREAILNWSTPSNARDVSPNPYLRKQL